jgi:polar amino acid transport system substrate-binding protein
MDTGGVTRIARRAGVRHVLFVLALLSSAVTGDAQQAPDPRVADLVRSGTLRVALCPPQVRKDPVTGETRRGAVFMELARALAARLGVDLQLIEYRTPVEAIDGLKSGACDLAFLATDPARAADVDFSPPFSQFDLLRTGRADAMAAPRVGLLRFVTRLPGSRVLVDRDGGVSNAVAIAKNQPARLAYISEFVEEAKASGLVQRALGGGDDGVQVAPRASPPRQK